VLVQHDRAKFVSDIPAFVSQVEEVDHLNLFLTSLG
jgi:elongator complex protein 1